MASTRGINTVGGRYAIEEPLDRGAIGHVYRALHLQLGKVFALRIVAPAFVADEDARRRFNQDAKLASEISHPNMISIVDFGEDAALGAYVVTELVEGTPLIEPRTPPFSLRRAIDVLGQLAGVLEHLHRRGIVLGDLKAESVRLVQDGRRQSVRLVDIGLAGRYADANAGGTWGAPEYLAPERVISATLTTGSDIYALGVLGFYMLAGRLPFEGSVSAVLMAHVYDTPPPISEVRGEPIEQAVEALIARALAKDPDQRHRSAAAFRHELDSVMELLVMHRRMSTSDMVEPVNAREAAIHMLFEHSGLAQAVVSPSGLIAVANRAFAQLVGERANVEGFELAETPLLARVPQLLQTIRSVQHGGGAIELRGRDLVVWVAPFSSESVHLVVRVDALLS